MIASGIDEKQVYEEFKALARELKVPVIDFHYSLEITKNGIVIDKRPRQRSHTFKRNAFNWMFSQLASHPYPDTGNFGASYVSYKDTAGNIRSNVTYAIGGDTTIDSLGSGYRGNLGVAYHGIVVGTGVGAESFDGFALTTRVEHGNGEGQLHHPASPLPAVEWDNDGKVMTATHIRYFNNNSGGSIVITEIGIYADLNTYKCMITRDLLGASITMVDASQLKVTYEVDLTYPE